jgi:hypothetical protein
MFLHLFFKKNIFVTIHYKKESQKVKDVDSKTIIKLLKIMHLNLFRNS